MQDLRTNGIAMKNVEKVTKIYADRVLDAPNMIDDFYLNLLDWSNENELAVALTDNAYIMNVSTKRILRVTPRASDCLITSLSWMNENKNTLAMGMEDGTVEIWDTCRNV